MEENYRSSQLCCASRARISFHQLLFFAFRILSDDYLNFVYKDTGQNIDLDGGSLLCRRIFLIQWCSRMNGNESGMEESMLCCLLPLGHFGGI